MVLFSRFSSLVFMLGVVALGMFLGSDYFKTGATIGAWKTSQFFFSYQNLGFVSRGLIATLLHPFPVLLTSSSILYIAIAILFVFVITWWRFLWMASRYLSEADRTALNLVCVFAPSMFLRVGFDYGRLDPLNVVITIFALKLLRKNLDFFAAALCAVAILIHEGFIFLHFLLLCAVVLCDERWACCSQRVCRLLRFIFFPSVAAAVTLICGRFEPGIDVLVNHFVGDKLYIDAISGGVIDRDSLLVITRSFKENLDFNIAFLIKRRPWADIIIIVVWFFVFSRFYYCFFRCNNLPRDSLYWSVYAPLVLSVVACDYFRWVSLSSINMFIVILVKIDEMRLRGRTAIMPIGVEAKLIAASFFLGPIGNTSSFPYFYLLLERLSNGCLE